MSTNILCIDTALSICSVALFRENKMLSFEIENEPNAASEKINQLIEVVLLNSKVKYHQLSAIALANGPGSYTGLRIGATVAKALAYSLEIPIIAMSTLDVMFAKAKFLFPNFNFYLANIDARRDEIYFALYDQQKIIGDKPQILDADFLSIFNNEKKFLIFGNATNKVSLFLSSKNNIQYLEDFNYNANDIGQLAYILYQKNKFTDVAYFEPNYTKPFFLHKKKS